MTNKPAIFGPEQLKQLAPFMCKEVTRFQLQGIFFDPAGYLVATNGNILGLIKAPEVAGIGKLLSAATVAQLLKMKPASAKRSLLFAWDGQTVSAHEYEKPTKNFEQPQEVLGHMVNVAGITAPGGDLTFPDWRRVIPSIATAGGDEALQSCGYNADYLAAFARPGEKYPSVIITPADGQRSIVLNSNPNFLGVIMQLHRNHIPSGKQAFGRAVEFAKRPEEVTEAA